VLFDLVRQLNTARAANDNTQIIYIATTLKSLGAVLGLLQDDANTFLQTGTVNQLDAARIDDFITERTQAKKDKNFTRSDEIRDVLKAQGIVLEDTRTGTTWRRE